MCRQIERIQRMRRIERIEQIKQMETVNKSFYKDLCCEPHILTSFVDLPFLGFQNSFLNNLSDFKY